MPLFDKVYIDSIREYVPEDAKVVLDEQIPRIRKAINDDLARFGEELKKHFTEVVEQAIEEQGKAEAQAMTLLKALVDGLKASTSDLKAKKDALKKGLDDFEQKWSGFGTKVGKLLHNAVNAAMKL